MIVAYPAILRICLGKSLYIFSNTLKKRGPAQKNAGNFGKSQDQEYHTFYRRPFLIDTFLKKLEIKIIKRIF